MENPIKKDDLGVPLFSETPTWSKPRVVTTDTVTWNESLHEMFTGHRDTDAVFAAWFYLKRTVSRYRGYRELGGNLWKFCLLLTGEELS